MQVVDAGLHPDYEDTLGGEYAIDILTLDLTIWNGGNDLDNGQNQGSAGMVVPDDEEETPGAYLLVNWDDDDHDGYITDDGTWSQIPEPDLNENWVENEDNLAQLVPFLSPLPEMGTAELELLGADVGKVKLRTQSEKGTQIQLEDGKKTWNLSVASERAEFEDIMQNGCWIEGVAPGTIERGIEFVFRLKNVGGGTLCEDLCRATVVMLHLGNAVYRENLVNVFGQFPLRERCHTGIVFSFDGPLTSIGLTNAAHYGILQMQGLSPEEKLNGLTSDPNAEYWYCYTDTSAVADNLDGYRKRLQILCVAKWLLEKWTPNYCAFDCMNPCSSIWNGKLNDVKELRCDGLVELVYEFNGIMVWGKIVDNGPPHYDMRVSAFLEEHNDWQWGDDPEDWDWDMYGTFLPVTQGGFADDYIREHNPEYMGPNFRGALWDTTFHEQRVTVPEVLSPERHAHGSSLQ